MIYLLVMMVVMTVEIGQTYDIEEMSLLDDIKSRINEETFSPKMFSEAVDNYKPHDQIELPEAIESEKYIVEPVAEVPYDIYDKDKRVVYRKGQKYNPLDYIKPGKIIYVIDATRQKHLDWVADKIKEEEQKKYVVMTTGNKYKEASNLLQEQVYLFGTDLNDTMKVSRVPARIEQVGNKYHVEIQGMQ